MDEMSHDIKTRFLSDFLSRTFVTNVLVSKIKNALQSSVLCNTFLSVGRDSRLSENPFGVLTTRKSISTAIWIKFEHLILIQISIMTF